MVLREVLGRRIRSARPLRVIEDSAERFIGYLVPRSTVAWPRLVDSEQSQTPDQGWRLPREEWFGPGSLFVVPAGAGFAVVLFLDAATGAPRSWKVDFFRPLRRHRCGFDTLDHAFDLLVELDGAHWEPKDLDDLAQLSRLGLLAGAERAAFDREVDRVEAWLRERGGPFHDPSLRSWRPDPTWPPLQLPPGWDDLTDAPATAAGAVELSGGGWRSAKGIRLLDGDGAVTLDLDLAGGALWHGHAPPPVVDALRRQVGLGWRLGPDHPAVQALTATVLGVAPAGWVVRWPASRTAAGDTRAADLDDALRRRGWPFDLTAACAGRAGGRFGAALFGGLSGALWVGPADAAIGSDPPNPGTDPHDPEPDPPDPDPDPDLADRGPEGLPMPDALAAVAALETLRLADPAVVARTAERAARLRSALGLGGDGPYLWVRPGWAAPGVALPAGGRGLVATCVDDDDEAELLARLGRGSIR